MTSEGIHRFSTAITHIEGGIAGFDLARGIDAVFYQIDVTTHDDDPFTKLRSSFGKLEYGTGVRKVSELYKIDLNSWRTEKVYNDGRYIREFTVTPDGKRIAVSCGNGEVRLVQIETSPGARSGDRTGTWRLDAKLAGLGTTYSIGVHIFDILRYLLDSEVTMVSAFFDTPRGVMEETNLSLLRFANGVLGQLSVHEKTPYPHNDFVIYGSTGRILGRGLTRSRSGGELLVTTADGSTRTTEYPSINAHGA